MEERDEVILQHLRDGSYGASGYATKLIEILLDNVLSPTADQEATRRLARKLKIIWPAFKAGILPRLNRTDMEWQPIETAPKGIRILAYGRLGLEPDAGIGTVMWNNFYGKWWCDPNEATECGPESCELTHWMPLPAPPTAKAQSDGAKDD